MHAQVGRTTISVMEPHFSITLINDPSMFFIYY